MNTPVLTLQSLALTLNQSLILSMHVATVERKNSLLTGRNLQQNHAQCERPSATTDCGFERTEQRHKKNTEALILVLDHLFAEYWTICMLLDATMPFQWHQPFCTAE
ncbi:hypothetical protein ILYODFUR_037696 [Ilyodon furcidens]|uniref:Secreted protein n=1 Tax=Ilyodon furcidens TaxID=33524 RepID=A0ABV0UBP2_9TELE